MMSGDRKVRFLFTTSPERENNRSHGQCTIAVGEAKYGAHFRRHSNGHKASLLLVLHIQHCLILLEFFSFSDLHKSSACESMTGWK